MHFSSQFSEKSLFGNEADKGEQIHRMEGKREERGRGSDRKGEKETKTK